jgi:hypothetical protein
MLNSRSQDGCSREATETDHAKKAGVQLVSYLAGPYMKISSSAGTWLLYS